MGFLSALLSYIFSLTLLDTDLTFLRFSSRFILRTQQCCIQRKDSSATYVWLLRCSPRFASPLAQTNIRLGLGQLRSYTKLSSATSLTARWPRMKLSFRLPVTKD